VVSDLELLGEVGDDVVRFFNCCVCRRDTVSGFTRTIGEIVCALIATGSVEEGLRCKMNAVGSMVVSVIVSVVISVHCAGMIVWLG